DVVHIPRRPGEPDCTFADTTKIREVLGWRPTVPFEEGVRIMLENIDYWREAPVWEPETISSATRDWFRYLGGEEIDRGPLCPHGTLSRGSERGQAEAQSSVGPRVSQTGTLSRVSGRGQGEGLRQELQHARS
ncbi:MAG: GDP-mannose 4,6-dehydratase, partial [Chloroflexota bacterium]|nr:GDP-mannose 4,6-dehydratase [Chloroflexota bacterium]